MSDLKAIARAIDHTLLLSTATRADIETLCEQAKSMGFAAVCVPPNRVLQCKINLEGSSVRVCTVVGFPLGNDGVEAKMTQARVARRDGAQEIDIVIDQGHVKDGNWAAVEEELAGVIDAFKQGQGDGLLTKVILETCNLTPTEKRRLCEICLDVGADFIKTSTGFGSGGATVEDVMLLLACSGGRCQIKASGGIRSVDEARAMIDAGATRLGTSHGMSIMAGAPSNSGQY